MNSYCNDYYHIAFILIGNLFGILLVPYAIFILGTFNEFLDHDNNNNHVFKRPKNIISTYAGLFTGIFASIYFIIEVIKDRVLCEESNFNGFGRYYLIIIGCCTTGIFTFIATQMYILVLKKMSTMFRKIKKR